MCLPLQCPSWWIAVVACTGMDGWTACWMGTCHPLPRLALFTWLWMQFKPHSSLEFRVTASFMQLHLVLGQHTAVGLPSDAAVLFPREKFFLVTILGDITSGVFLKGIPCLHLLSLCFCSGAALRYLHSVSFCCSPASFVSSSDSSH